MAPVALSELGRDGPAESSAEVALRVERARRWRRNRERRAAAGDGVASRGRAAVADLEPEARRLLLQAVRRLGLSARAHDAIVRVARTIADLSGSDAIGAAQVAEAAQYRAFDRGAGGD